MNKSIVHLMRGGAPDKVNLPDGLYHELVKHDHTNLVDYTDLELTELINKGDYILPADEGDIIRANKFDANSKLRTKNILLPQFLGHVINYDEFVPKDSEIYTDLPEYLMIYMPFKSFLQTEVKELDEYIHSLGNHSPSGFEFRFPIAVKSTTGSGSRGVILYDPDRVNLGGKYYMGQIEDPYYELVEPVVRFARSEGPNCKIMIQELIPNDPELTKINVDFVIREGKLLGYMWTITDPEAVFTNWNWCYIFRNEWTDRLMHELVDYLHSKGITDAIMNFEAFSDNESMIYLVEFNWRYSNSMFQSLAYGINLIDSYLMKLEFGFPYGKDKLYRTWTPKRLIDINGYVDRK